MHKDVAFRLYWILRIISHEGELDAKKFADLSDGHSVCATILSLGTFRSALLTMRRHHKLPQSAVIHLRCINHWRTIPSATHMDVRPGPVVRARRDFPRSPLRER